MSTVLEIEEAVAKLPEPDFQTFAAWFDQTRASRVDDAFESAILGGQFDEMAARAVRDHQAGKTVNVDSLITMIPNTLSRPASQNSSIV